MTIGIPRAIHCGCRPGLRERFFSALDLEVVVSQAASQQTIQRDGLLSESEHCLPAKLLDAHVKESAY